MQYFQFVYQSVRSTLTAINHVLGTIGKAQDARSIYLSAFNDIHGAFDNTSYDAIGLDSTRKGVAVVGRN